MDTYDYRHADGELPLAVATRRDTNGKIINTATLWFDGTRWNRVHDYYQRTWQTIEQAFEAACENFDREAEVVARLRRG